MGDEELSKFTVDDLLKTHDDIEKFLNKIGSNTMTKGKIDKADESDYVPDETVDHGAHEEEGGEETTTSVEKEGEEFIDDEPEITQPDEEMTAPSEGDALSRVTEAMNDMRTMLAAILEAVQPAVPEVAPEMAPPGIEEKSGSGQGFSITIGKEIQKQLAAMGLKKSVKTNKPKVVDTGHPIEKTGESFDLKKMKDMTWREVDALNEKVNSRPGRKFY